MLTNINTNTDKKRIHGIDCIRGLSIIRVILLHICVHVPLGYSAISKLLPHKIFNIIFRSGYYGVMVFFVISGFLITSNTIKRWGSIDNVPYKTFYFIRFARIAPSLLALLLILSLLHILGIEWFVIQNTSLIQALFSALTFQVNWLEYQTNSHLPAAWDLLWSLSVEEMFYLFFPVICIFIKNRIIFIFVMLAFIALGPFARTVFSTNDNWLDHSYLSCMDGIAIGCLAALFATMATFNKDKILKWFLWSGIVMFSIVFFFRKLTYDIGLTKVGLKVTILEVSIAFILIAIAKNQIQLPKLRFISSSLRWFGKNSYEIYLTHMLIEIPLFATFYLVQNSFVLSSLWCLAIVILCGLVGQIVSKYYSEPMNKVLRYKYLVK